MDQNYCLYPGEYSLSSLFLLSAFPALLHQSNDHCSVGAIFPAKFLGKAEDSFVEIGSAVSASDETLLHVP